MRYLPLITLLAIVLQVTPHSAPSSSPDLFSVNPLGLSPALFIWAWLQGEAAVIVAGSLAAQGHWPWWAVWLIAAIPATVGHQIYYHLGRSFGERILHRLPQRTQPAIERARVLVRTYETTVLAVMRFAYGIRMPLPILCGVARIRWQKFVLFNVGTALLWSLVFTMVGYTFGLAAQAVFKQVSTYTSILLIGSIVFGLIVHFGTHFWGRRFVEGSR